MTNERTQNKQEEKERIPVRRNNYRGRRNNNQEKKGEEKAIEIQRNIIEPKKEELSKNNVQAAKNTRNSRNTKTTRNAAIAKKTEGKIERRSHIKSEEKLNFEFKKENLKIIPLRRIRRNWKKYNRI